MGDTPSAVAVSPNGATVFVTGTGFSGPSDDDDAYATVAYRAASGRQLWVSRYNSPVNGNGADSVAVSPDGATVFVTGTSDNTTTGYDCATIAYHG